MLLQRQDVGDVAPALDREDEIVRRLRRAMRRSSRALEAIERAVDLDGGEVPGGVVQLALRRQARRVEAPAPGRVAPAGDADADLPAPRAASRWSVGTTARPAVGSANARFLGSSRLGVPACRSIRFGLSRSHK